MSGCLRASELFTDFIQNTAPIKKKGEIYMSNVALLRIDDRLVHGQVVTKWIQDSGANTIIIVDDFLATNSYLSNVYKMAAPKGINVSIYSVEDFCTKEHAGDFADLKLLLLFKSVDSLVKTFDSGFFTEKVQIGGLGASAGKKLVYRTIALSEAEAKQLVDILNKGVEIYFQVVPDDRPQPLESIVQKKFSILN